MTVQFATVAPAYHKQRKLLLRTKRPNDDILNMHENAARLLLGSASFARALCQPIYRNLVLSIPSILNFHHAYLFELLLA
jgi:hypothetical protein